MNGINLFDALARAARAWNANLRVGRRQGRAPVDGAAAQARSHQARAALARQFRSDLAHLRQTGIAPVAPLRRA